jgi:uncharacterized LabA/DUF88 family protein
MHTQGRVYVFLDFSDIKNAEQITRFQDFVKNFSSIMVCKSYDKSLSAGFDAKLNTDILIGAREDVYDEAIIVSSDADLVPAINYIRNRFGKKVTIFLSIDDLVL